MAGSLVAASLAAAPAPARSSFPTTPRARPRRPARPAPPAGSSWRAATTVSRTRSCATGPRRDASRPRRTSTPWGRSRTRAGGTNRIGVRAMSHRGAGPRPEPRRRAGRPGDLDGVSGKSGGITPGLHDPRLPRRRLLPEGGPARLLRPGHGAMSSAAGSSMPSATSSPRPGSSTPGKDQIRIGSDARVRVQGMKPRQMTPGRPRRDAGRASPRLPDGTLRFVASKAVPGQGRRPPQVLRDAPRRPQRRHPPRAPPRAARLSRLLRVAEPRRLPQPQLPRHLRHRGRPRLPEHYLQDFSSILGSGSDWRRGTSPPRTRGPGTSTSSSSGPS